MDVITKVVEEMKAKPFTMLTIIGLYVAVGVLWAGSARYANAAELQALKQQLASVQDSVYGVKVSLDRTNVETQLRSINTELFQLQRTVADLQAARKQVEPVYWSRISALQNDKEQLTRQLAALK